MTGAATAQRPTILIVDDDFDLREILVDVLEDEGFHVRWARDGADALAELKIPPRVHLIVLDLNMPKMDGHAFRAEQQIDTLLAPIPVVVVSGLDHLMKAVVDLSPTAVLEKPFTLDAFLRTVRNALLRAGTATIH